MECEYHYTRETLVRGEVYLGGESREGTSCVQLNLVSVPVVRSAVCNAGAFWFALLAGCKLRGSESPVVFQCCLAHCLIQTQSMSRVFAHKLQTSSSHKLIFIRRQHFDHCLLSAVSYFLIGSELGWERKGLLQGCHVACHRNQY